MSDGTKISREWNVNSGFVHFGMFQRYLIRLYRQRKVGVNKREHTLGTFRMFQLAVK